MFLVLFSALIPARYDFTPKPGNWKTLSSDLTVLGLLAPVPEEALTAFGKHGKDVGRNCLLECWPVNPPPYRDTTLLPLTLVSPALL